MTDEVGNTISRPAYPIIFLLICAPSLLHDENASTILANKLQWPSKRIAASGREKRGGLGASGEGSAVLGYRADVRVCSCRGRS